MTASAATPDAAGPDAVFAALGDPTRRGLLEAIGQRPEVTATELAADLPISRQGVVKHLQVLAGAGLVHVERVGREQRYRLDAAPLGDAVGWMLRTGAAWDRRLDRLRQDLG